MATAKKDLTGNPVQGRHRVRSNGERNGNGGLPQLLTVTELAQALRVTPEYVTRRLVFERRIRFIKVGRRTLFDAADVKVFLATRTVTPED